MNIPGLKEAASKLISDNASTILTAGGVIGTVLTATLAARAGGNAALRIDIEQRERTAIAMANDPDAPDVELTTMEKLKIAAPLFIPPVIVGTLTITSIVMSNQVSARRAAALAAAYGLSEQRFQEYRDKVAEKLTKPKLEQLEGEVAQAEVDKNPPGPQVVILGEGLVLCYESLSGRYFQSTAEKIRRAQNAVNNQLFHHQYCSLSFFYEEIGLPSTDLSDQIGWNMVTADHGQLELKLTSTLVEGEKPCLNIGYNILPKPEYTQLY